jgi:hypothetical protein
MAQLQTQQLCYRTGRLLSIVDVCLLHPKEAWLGASAWSVSQITACLYHDRRLCLQHKVILKGSNNLQDDEQRHFR